MKRNQVLFKEGDVSKFVYIIKDGQYSINKQVFQPKHNEIKYERGLLKNNTTTTRRFNNNFQKQMGLRREFEINIMLAEKGKMVGDSEVINNKPYQTTVMCHSINASVLCIKKDEYLKLQSISDESFQELKALADEK